MEVVDVKNLRGGRKITTKNLTEVAKKVSNDMFLKQIMKN